MFDFEAFGGFGKEVRSTLREAVNELACGESGIVHGAECIAVLNGVA